MLEEIDGTVIAKPVAGKRIKRFYSRDTTNPLVDMMPAVSLEHIEDDVIDTL